MRRHDPHARAAFTLIELTIVMLVMGILAGVAVPRYVDSLAHSRVDAAARRVAADLRYARAEALRSSEPKVVQFYPANNDYQMPAVADPDHPAQPYQIDLAAEPYDVDIADVNFGGVESVSFGIHGMPSSNGYVRLQSRGKRIAVICNGMGDTGYASW